MNATVKRYYKLFLQNHGYCTPPGRAVCALRDARTVAEFEELESQGLVRIKAEPEQESYFDVYGEPDNEKERKATEDYLERWGCWAVFSEYFDGDDWQHADCIGMCVYADPMSPVENDYVPELMRAAIQAYKETAFFQDQTVTL